MSSDRFTPLVVEVTEELDPDVATLTFHYAANNPVTDVGISPDGTYWHGPNPLRIWTVDGDTSRRPQSVATGGNFVPSSTALTLRQLGLTDSTTKTLFIESIRYSGAFADHVIDVALDADGPSSSQLRLTTDRVRLTSASLFLIPFYINQDDPQSTQQEPLVSGADRASVVYGGSEPSTADNLRFTAMVAPNGLSPSSYVWSVSDTSVVEKAPPSGTSSSAYDAGNIWAKPGPVTFGLVATLHGTKLRVASKIEVGVRTDDALIVAWIDPQNVPLWPNIADPRVTALFKPNGTVSDSTEANGAI